MTKGADNWIEKLAAPLLAKMRENPKAALPLPAIPQTLEAALLLGIARRREGPLIWITDGPRNMEIMARNLRTLNTETSVELFFYPPLPGNQHDLEAVFSGRERLSTLTALASGPSHPLLTITCIEAVLQTCPAPADLRRNHRILETGDEWERGEMKEFLRQTGYRAMRAVHEPGQTAVRGGIVDIWPVRESHPYRLEFFGSTIESIRIFDPSDQRSIATRPSLHVGIAAETGSAKASYRKENFTAYWPAGTAVAWAGYADIERHVILLRDTSPTSGTGQAPAQILAPLHAACEDACRPQIYLPAPATMAPLTNVLPEDVRFIEGLAAPSDNGSFQPDTAEQRRRAFVRKLIAAANAGAETRIYFNTTGALAHFRKTFDKEPGIRQIGCRSGWVSDGFHLPALRHIIIGEDLLYGRFKGRRPRFGAATGGARESQEIKDGSIGPRLTEWNDLQPGDPVVHVRHGIGRYLGLQTSRGNAFDEEYMVVAYADDARLFVPVSQAHLLSRYIGAAHGTIRLHRLGGTRWNRERHAAARAIEDLAAGFIEIQASRMALAGHAFSADPPWFHDFEAAFPFEETADQARAIADVMRDMESARPMDRLICGDAGYGKTEVAMRAAFKAVMDGKQVAVFVPTTVLAQQHYYTFGERMAPYPINIETLSRFSSTEERRRVYRGLRSGAIDIVIGTHCLLNPGLKFRDLGLAIIDEEQRFGVMHKEKFKHIRRMLDVLTMTATPIPRTLYLGLTGVRELSAIRTPPRERLAIETEIAEDGNEIVRHAVLRELSRDGQVYFLHNRVQEIENMYQRLAKLVPEARIEIAHGQMTAQTLPDKMRRFAAGRFDVLLCTTIIESGLDIPAANTIIVNRADRFGLAELYQLRGRVGRSGVRAHALLLLPKHGLADPQARKRVGALREYAHPGAGFEIALRDLETRGAGNLLGPEQSGHITAIGFNLYCQMLQRTVARFKGREVPALVDVELRLDFLRSPDSGATPAAKLPDTYVDDETERMRLYRRIAEAVGPQQITELRDELRDRFGPPPRSVNRLLSLAQLRIAAAAKKIQHIETSGAKVMMRRSGGWIMPGGRFPRIKHGSPEACLRQLHALLGKNF